MNADIYQYLFSPEDGALYCNLINRTVLYMYTYFSFPF